MKQLIKGFILLVACVMAGVFLCGFVSFYGGLAGDTVLTVSDFCFNAARGVTRAAITLIKIGRGYA